MLSVTIGPALFWLCAAVSSATPETIEVQRPVVQRPTTPAPTEASPVPVQRPEGAPGAPPSADSGAPPSAPVVQRPAGMPVPAPEPAGMPVPHPSPAPEPEDPTPEAPVVGPASPPREATGPTDPELHDPFVELPDAPGPSRRDWMIAAGLWGGAATVVVAGVVVQRIELRIVEQRCFGSALDFDCSRPSPSIRWAQLGAVLLWGSGAGLTAGGVSRLGIDARGRERARRARLGVGATLTAIGGAGVLATSLGLASTARGCEDVECLTRATLVRIVATDVSMIVVTLGAALLASSVRRRSRVSASAGIDRRGAGLGLMGWF
ncbi:hypothetical protein [Paraliomyxa miuraensis]|uniref:hypothetical protein n=1 Tax=Paraliomyxa miuraensis TaxID=376150 RepID=UPI0022502CEE|nr:hypothetical protein [Paraliomyxa miuraensis]MCX4244240.1 hypothetical protein [Paraliomyxa miuraensis]